MTERDITYFAKTNFRGQEHVFGIKRDDRRRHMYIIGKTGMGKTNLLETLVIADIKAGNGVAVVDPHGDFAEKILNFVPASRINDVVYFNPADIDYPIAFNVMEQVDSKYRHLICSGLIGVFKKIWADSWGPRLEYLLRNVILGLLEYPGSTLLGVPRMLVDKEYRAKVVAKITDPVVKAFWTTEFTKYSAQFTVDAISPIQNKVGQFLSSALVRNIISQTKSSIDMRDIMDNRKIFIVNLAKGKIGEDYSALLGAMLITKIQLAAMGRTDIPEGERKDFYLYVDEFQNFATESFAGILSEARKYRLNLIVAHQYIGQLEEEVSDAIFGNVGTLITFRVGAADAEFLEKEYEPIFMMNDLVNLGKYNIYLKLMIDGVAGDAFSATTLPPNPVSEKSNAEKIIKVSRERYASKRDVVEDKISRWSGVDMGETVVESERPRREKEGGFGGESKAYRSDKTDRELWDASCAMCNEKIKVPFKPDPNRETYCRNCLIEVRKKMPEGPKKIQPEVKMDNIKKPETEEKKIISDKSRMEKVTIVKIEDPVKSPMKEIKEERKAVLADKADKKKEDRIVPVEKKDISVKRVEIKVPQVSRAQIRPKAPQAVQAVSSKDSASPVSKAIPATPRIENEKLKEKIEKTKPINKGDMKEGEAVKF